MSIEILSPAGGFESLTAAVRCGANAVYLGTKQFSARKNAENFDFEELKEAIRICHSVGVKVHVTMNTLISDDEIELAMDTIKHICSCGADVLILQDLGLASLVRKSAPEILRHASTQLSVQTCFGVNLLDKMGFSRVVLPREISKEEIKYIRENTKTELEAFIHGALCMCVSGQCYLSAMLGSRSGNRGLCAQPCRLPFGAENGTGHDLSLKDLSLVDEINELAEIGVCSVKIEGRMKRPEYVAAAVTACKNAAQGQKNEEISSSLKAVFSRSGFTKGYYESKLGREMFGTRQKEDVVSANKVLAPLKRLYDREMPLIPVDFYLTVYENEKITLSASSMGKSSFAESDVIPEKAINRAVTKEELEKRLSKCGGTVFYANTVEIDLDEGLVVSPKEINALRRKVLDDILDRLRKVNAKKYIPNEVKISPHKAAQLRRYIRVDTISQIPDNLSGIDAVYLPLDTSEDEILALSEKIRVGVEIPRGLLGSEKAVYERLKLLAQKGVKLAFCTSFDGVAMAKSLNMDIVTSFTLNAFNTVTLNELESLGVSEAVVSPELTLQKIKRLGGEIPRGIVAYGNIPLMLTRNCPIKNGKTCGECKRNSYLKDRISAEFPVLCRGGFSEVLNSRPIYLADRIREIENVDFILLYFTKEDKLQVSHIIENYKNGSKPETEFTRGLYYRGVE